MSVQYETGFDFFMDLQKEYGTMEAVKIANSYLDIQSRVYGSKFREKEPEEFNFCCELFKATRQAANN